MNAEEARLVAIAFVRQFPTNRAQALSAEAVGDLTRLLPAIDWGSNFERALRDVYDIHVRIPSWSNDA